MLIKFITEGRTLAHVLFKPVEQNVMSIALSRRERLQSCRFDEVRHRWSDTSSHPPQADWSNTIPDCTIEKKGHDSNMLMTYVTRSQQIDRVLLKPTGRVTISICTIEKRVQSWRAERIRHSRSDTSSRPIQANWSNDGSSDCGVGTATPITQANWVSARRGQQYVRCERKSNWLWQNRIVVDPDGW